MRDYTFRQLMSTIAEKNTKLGGQESQGALVPADEQGVLFPAAGDSGMRYIDLPAKTSATGRSAPPVSIVTSLGLPGEGGGAVDQGDCLTGSCVRRLPRSPSPMEFRRRRLRRRLTWIRETTH